MAYKETIGRVTSNKMDKTITVVVINRVQHKKYNKIVATTNKYYANDPNNKCNIGDIVRIQQTKPMSKNKRWQLINIII